MLKNMNGKILTLLALLLVGGFVAASPYEWITSFYLASNNNPGCLSQAGNEYWLTNLTSCNSYKAIMAAQGSSNWLENVAFYTSIDNGVNWNFLPKSGGGDCKAQIQFALFNGNYTLSYVCTFSRPAANDYLFRTSINYNGCGSYTPVPNVATCGDTRDVTVHVLVAH